MRQCARLTFNWPDLDAEINNTANSFESCVSRLPSQQAEPLHPHESATSPFQFVHADIGEDDVRHFLVIVDQFSGEPEVTMYNDRNTTAYRLGNSSRAFCATFGAPEGL